MKNKTRYEESFSTPTKYRVNMLGHASAAGFNYIGNIFDFIQDTG